MEYFEENDEETEKLKRIVPDTSAVIEGTITKIINDMELKYPEIIIPEAVVAELEYQTNKQRMIGQKGLDELKKLQKLNDKGIIAISFAGKRPNNYEISLSKAGEIDSIIRDVAKNELATLITCDRVQSEVAEAQGIPVIYIKQESDSEKALEIAKYFDDTTMSVHLKENVVPMAKKGKPGSIELVKLTSTPISYEYLEKLAEEIIQKANHDFKTYLEVDEEGATVVQSREYRISIAKPPFSEGMEITAVRPVAEVSLENYALSDKLMDRLRNEANGILISGSPGAGKSTFAQAVAKFFSECLNKIVKTMESPRDLQVGDEITQYAPLDGDMEKTADILLLVRPDFTIYDELRKNHDFNIFADMRLAGVGMIGVVHATRPIDAIQRIAARVELGIIPSIVDTTIYIEDGEIRAIYEAKLTVKVPSGMQEADLARPVIEVRDFETGDLKNEIYTYGEQTIVMDVDLVQSPKGNDGKAKKSSVDKIAEKEVIRAIKKLVPRATVKAEVISSDRVKIYVNEEFIPKIIGKKGKRIDDLERKVGISIGVEPLESFTSNNNEKIDHKKGNELFEASYEISKSHLILDIGYEHIGEEFDVIVNEEYLFTATVGKKGLIRLKQGLEIVDFLLEAIDLGIPLMVKLRSKNH
ncbi:type II/IV secretion system protein [Methanobrevibacter cuticularis]|uniref:Type II/IV secretion system protein n=1 Tax=Methanobrevibacter cuticularis TaxID=47311 RepID=A0A166DQV5_9EURY|nr:PINc/VapC family ATPase [Methanobrevibacter cuticularis]KZX15862.1 type II/IV secretion system protein [Methanobrevibacter cuticularis]